ncbi:hypothetical protein V6Z12_D06G075600 [Gossypium hirsutum]
MHQDDVSADVLNSNKEWIVDSGCFHHVTGNDTLLSDVRPHRKNKVIVTADNSLHPVKKEGNLNDRDVLLKDVYHVRGLKKNIASVSQITYSKRKESLYLLSTSDEYLKKASRNGSSTLSHARLGHVGFQLLQKISTNQLLNGIPVFKGIHHDEI